MKKAISLLLALVLALALCACGGTSAPAATPAPAQSAAPASEAPAPASEVPAAESTAPTAAWPSGDVTVYIPYDVGSASDISYRTMCDYLAEKTGVNFVVENDSTGGGARLAAQLAEAKPDGQTMLICGTNMCANYYQGFWDYSLADDEVYKAVSGASGPNPYSGSIIAANPDVPYNTFEEFVDYVEAHPGEVTVGISVGKSTEPKTKCLFEYFGLTDKVRYVSANDSEMLTGLMGGSINVGMLSADKCTSYGVEGSLKCLFNYCTTRDLGRNVYTDAEIELLDSLEILPDIMPEADVESVWVMFKNHIFVPAGTPDDVCQQIYDTMESITKDTAWMERIYSLSPVSGWWSSGSFEDFVAELDTVDKQCEAVYSGK